MKARGSTVLRSLQSHSQLVYKHNAQLRALVKLLTHRFRSSIYGLAMIWELALNATLDMKHIFSIIME